MNRANFTRVMDQIRKHPELWDQCLFARRAYDAQNEPCDTAFCVAGWAHAFKALDEGRSAPTIDEIDKMDVDETVQSALEFFGIAASWSWADFRLLPYAFHSERVLQELEEVERGERDFMTGELSMERKMEVVP